MVRKLTSLALVVVVVALASVVGCGDSQPPPPPAGNTEKNAENTEKNQAANASEIKKEGEHAHKPGAHGGIIVEIGRDNYHAEAVFEKGGVLRLYTLGKDEAKVQEVESQTLTAYVKVEGGTDAEKLELKPERQQGDSPAKTSQFVSRLPKELWGQRVEVTIPSITIAGERFRFGFTNISSVHGDDAMPSRVAAEEEKALYLTPGGIYTEADIKANGNRTASQKFQGFKPKHDLKPKVGEKICPITLTKANPECTWIVGGKTYEFCCPPCVDEFVQMAKDKDKLTEILEPGEYVKKK